MKCYQEKTTNMMHSNDRSHSDKRFLKRYNAQQVIAQRNLQREENLQKLQVASIIKKAVAENNGLQSKLFDSIKQQIPDNPQAFDIFQRQLENITSKDPDGMWVDSFAEQFLEFLQMGDYALEETANDDDVELEDALREAKELGISTSLGEIAAEVKALKKRAIARK